MNILQLENKLAELDIFPTAREICSVIDMNEQSYSRKKKAETDIKQADIRKLEQYYNISFSQQNVDNSIVAIPSYGEASCGNGITIDSTLINQYDVNAQYAFCIAKGSSMMPTINENDIIIMRKYDGNFVDGIYVFSIRDELFIKRLSKNINQLVCLSDNPVFDKIVLQGDELETVNILGRVVTVVRRYN